ncbi:MAG: DUF3592 domain-containing protein [Candidatus Paceibacterota bacterium]
MKNPWAGLIKLFIQTILLFLGLSFATYYFLLVAGVNPFHEYEVKTCQGILKFSDEEFNSEKRINVELIEAPPLQSITQVITHENFDSKLCSADKIDLFGNSNLVACYKSKQSGALSVEGPFATRVVCILFGLMLLAILIWPIRLQVNCALILLKGKENANINELYLAVGHHLAITAVILVFLCTSIPEDIVHKMNKNWKATDCKIISVCKPEAEKNDLSITYEYTSKLGMIRHREILDDSAIKQTDNYQEGNNIACFVNPNAPQQSSLHPHKPFSYNRYLILLILVTLWLWKGWPSFKSWAKQSKNKKTLTKR